MDAVEKVKIYPEALVDFFGELKRGVFKNILTLVDDLDELMKLVRAGQDSFKGKVLFFNEDGNIGRAVGYILGKLISNMANGKNYYELTSFEFHDLFKELIGPVLKVPDFYVPSLAVPRIIEDDGTKPWIDVRKFFKAVAARLRKNVPGLKVTVRGFESMKLQYFSEENKSQI